MKQSILTNKKGFELSVNFIVMLIITLIVFGGTLTIAYKLMNNVDNLKVKMDAQTEQRLESMITDSNEEVVIAFNKKEVDSGDSAVFGLGITNMNLRATRNFSVNLTPSIKVLGDGTSLNWDGNGWGFLKTDNLGEIKNNDHKIVSLVIITPKNADPGITYVFDVKVNYVDESGIVRDYPPTRNVIQKIRVMIT